MMPLRIGPCEIDLGELPGLIRAYSRLYPGVTELERIAKALIKDDFSDSKSVEFIHAVCRWGGYAGIGERVEMSNSCSDVSKSMRAATKCLSMSDPRGALCSVLALKHLGMAFASKHLRFLDPKGAVVLDSIL